MAGWVDNYLSASFRGVPFYVESANQAGGRRLVEHVFPERDDSDFEDLGRRNRKFPITAYLIGDDYYQQRDELIKALEEEGTGTLIHPYRGELDVKVQDYSSDEVESEGRIVRISINFVWISDKKLITKGPTSFENLYQKRQNFFEKAVDFLENVYDVATKPAGVLDDAIDVANQALDVVEAAKKVTGSIDEYQAKLDTLKGKLQQATLLIGAIGQDFVDLISFGTDVKDTSYDVASGDFATEQFSELRSVVQVQDQTLSEYPSLVENGFAPYEIQKHVSRVSMCSQAGLIGTMTIDNSRQADDALKEINDQIDRIEEDETISDDLYDAARDLRVAVKAVIADRKLTLDRLAITELAETEPAIVSSYRLYGNTDRDLEIADLNEVLHPGFIPGIVEIDIQVS